jgi:hypothetical protein
MGGDCDLGMPSFTFESVVSSLESRDTGESGSRSIVEVFVKPRPARSFSPSCPNNSPLSIGDDDKSCAGI